ncbi:type I polyketide synthase [Streptomyces sp. NBC_01725]|uniref:type I polyketide synthase n=1 Tax=Streptomyces sp. NBC_01725 TaxID=2975923 RepID=UPI003FCDA075
MSTEDKLRDYLKRVTADLRRTRQRLDAAVSGEQEPIAIVGVACRFPGGVASPEDLWRVLADGVDTVSTFPTDRGWDLERAVGESETLRPEGREPQGAFLDDIAGFDAEFFNISPREALAMDPQQRVILEIAWEAVEHARIEPRSLRGGRTGVFIGATHQDYGPRLSEPAEGVQGHLMTGSLPSVISGRVAFTLGLEGPAVTVDTACSSSLTALHLACQSLRQSECDLALAGGVTLMATPGMLVDFDYQGGLAPDGRCKAFSDGADGTGLAEGAGVVLVERLSDAVRNGHEILAVVRGSAVNQDGASNGLSAPNGPSQQRVIRQALANAGLSVADVDAVEAHGTGTTLGDPIEAQALLATYGQDRPENAPLWLGSLKSNLGHTQAAAGVAGVIKMVLAMREGVLPRTLHADEPSSHIDWSSETVRLLGENTPWPEGEGRPRRAGVSAFGISGTNAHVILEQAPAAEPVETTETDDASGSSSGVVVWPVSGHTAPALAAQASRLHAHLAAHPEITPEQVAHALTTTRTALSHRGAVVAADRGELLEGLAALGEGAPSAHVVSGVTRPQGKTVFVFPGQGAQWPLMTADLLTTEPVYAQSIDACAKALAPYVDWSLRDVLTDPAGELLERVDVVQPALFAVMVSLARLWEHHGTRADAVIGHSQGEIAAAHIAGALSLEDAAKIVALRSKALTSLTGRGTMASVTLPHEQVTEQIAGYDSLSVAVINSPTHTVISGTTEDIHTYLDHCTTNGVQTRLLPVDYASHSPHVEALEEHLLTVLADITPQAASIPFHSTTHPIDRPTDTATLNNTYWYDNLRQPVHFHTTLTHLNNTGHTTYIETSPHPTLTTPINQTNEETNDTPLTVTGTLRRHQHGPTQFRLAQATLHTHNTPTTWPTPTTQPTTLPTYAFQHQHYWLNTPTGTGSDPTTLGLQHTNHPLLGAAIQLADSTTHATVFTGTLNQRTHPWLSDHTVTGITVLPATAYVDLALHAGHHTNHPRLTELEMHKPLVIPEQATLQLQVMTAPLPDSDDLRVTVHVRQESDAAWVLHATGTLSAAVPAAEADLTAWPPADARPVAPADVYTELVARGNEYGPAFQGLTAAWRDGDDLYAEIELDPDTDVTGYGIHPALLDAALHTLGIDTSPSDANEPQLPALWRDISLYATGATTLRVHLRRSGPGSARVLLADAVGQPVAKIESVALRPVETAQLAAADTSTHNRLFAVEWTATALASDGGTDAVDHQAWTILTAGTPATALPESITHLELDPADPDLPLPEQVHHAAAQTLQHLQDWLTDPANTDRHLIVLTHHAVTTHPGENITDLTHAPLWGLIRSAQNEHPHRITLIDTDNHPNSHQQLTHAIATGEPQLALRNGDTLVPRLARHTPTPGNTLTLNPHGTTLITGGTGTLGALTARHLVTTHGARHLLLTSRTGPDAEGAHELHQELTALGANVRITACDAADREQLTALLDTIPAEHPLTAVIHTAGVLDDATIDNLTPQHFATVLAPKVDAAWNLHQLTADHNLDAFILFSSAAATLGATGQANYATANTFLDALAHHRHHNGQPTTSLAWGYWAQTSGMTAHMTTNDINRLTRTGITPLTTQQALTLLDTATTHPHLIPTAINTTTIDPDTASPVLRKLIRPRRTTAARSTVTMGGFAEELRALPESEQRERLVTLVVSHAAVALGHSDGTSLLPHRPFRELGIGSLTAVELRNSLARAIGSALPTTVVFDYPTPQELADHLRGLLLQTTAAPRRSIAAVRTAEDEPIAIVGMACRFPGDVRSPEDLWQLLRDERDAVGDFPTNRGWDVERLYDTDPDHPGTSYVRHGAFLHDAAEFDADLFHMSPREALATDPQQRLLLETAWEAFERAGIDPTSLRGTGTGVFTGVVNHDYLSRLSSVPDEFEGYRRIGTAPSVASGRVSYAFGLEGPAVTVDTACSSSLVALHLACQSLRSGESTIALAGGVSLMASPDLFVEFSRQRGLAPDGRCKPFAAGADGTGWSEGVGLLLVERLSDAVRNGHEVLALVRGSAVNQDGASNGLTAPNGPSQERVIRQALANSGLSAADVDAVEAHGTGTMLGDPIEAQALLATYGQDRSDGTPLWLGAVKSNIGHTQAAAGVAGIIKMVMAMREGVLPRTLHVDEPTPHVDWSAGAVELLTENTPWTAGEDRPRRAGVSSFGISGTNVHVVLEQAPAIEPVEGETEPSESGSSDVVVWPVSGHTAPALAAQAAQLHAWLEDHPDADLPAVADALGRTRATLDHRAVVFGTERGELLEALAGIAAGTPTPHGVTGRYQAGKLAVLFTGQGSQYPGMGHDLYTTHPVFRDALDEACAALDPHLPVPLLSVMFAEPGTPEADLLHQTTYTQPALFALETALYRLAQSYGVRPDALAGHSIGELTAAHAAGVFTLTDAATLVTTRARLMGELPAGHGTMLTLHTTPDHITPLIDGTALEIAARNSPTNTVVSGTVSDIEALTARAAEAGIRTRALNVSHAFHSAHMDPVLTTFRTTLSALDPQAPALPVISNRTGLPLTPEQALSPDYWTEQLRHSVNYTDITEHLDTTGTTAYLELGPDTTLTTLTTQTLPDATATATLHPKHPHHHTLHTALATLHTHHTPLTWPTTTHPTHHHPTLPTYAFQHHHYWLNDTPAIRDLTSAGLTTTDHPLLGATVDLAQGDSAVFTSSLSLRTHPWLADHTIANRALLPGTAFVDLALHAGLHLGCDRLTDLTLATPLAVPEQGSVQLQVTVAQEGSSGERIVTIHSRPDGFESPWTAHATGLLAPAEEGSDAPATGLEAWPPHGAATVDVGALYADFAAQGYAYGPAFQGLRAAWQADGHVYAEVELASDVDVNGFGVHPALLDAALHTLALDARTSGHSGDEVKLPYSWSGIRLYATGATAARVRLTPTSETTATVTLSDATGQPLLEIDVLTLRSVDAKQLNASAGSDRDGRLFVLDWTEMSPVEETTETVVSDLRIFAAGPDTGEFNAVGSNTSVFAALPPLGLELPLPERVFTATAHTLHVVRDWLSDDSASGAPLVVVTRGAVSVAPENDIDLVHAPLWGLLRSAQSEHPHRFLLVDVDDDPASLAALPSAVTTAVARQEPQLALRAGAPLVPRLVRHDAGAPTQESATASRTASATTFRPDGTVLITGGTGAFGARIARHLVSAHGVRHLLLVSRSGPDTEPATALRQELTGLGAEVVVAACDAADRDGLAALVSAIPADRPLSAVVHAAGVLDDGTLAQLTPEQLRGVQRPKADAAWHLHELTRDLELDAFILVSAGAATLGTAGQGNYAAANTFLDALAAHRRHHGLPGLSLAWGFLAQDAGMTGHLDERDRARLARNGAVPLSVERALELFDAALAQAAPAHLLPLAMDSAQPLLHGLVRKRRAVTMAVAGRPSGSASGAGGQGLAELPPEARLTRLTELVTTLVAAVLGHVDSQQLDPGRTFSELGFDSLTAVELRNQLGAATGLQLSSTLVFDYPTQQALATYLSTRFAETATVRPSAHTQLQDTEPIAVVGMACRYPGGVTTPDDLWELLQGGRDAISDFPDNRGWDLDSLYDPVPGTRGSSYVREGGFLHDAGQFDPSLFGMSPQEALATDPQQRLLLETAWETFERAGIDPRSLRGSQTGVFAGVMYSDYAARLLPDTPEGFEGQIGNGSAPSIASGRVSYAFGLEGPAVTVDTACSSSLVALHLACQSLRSGESSLALAGGVTVMASPSTYVEFSQQRGLAPDGRCKPFAAGADGTGWSEGVGLLLVERLSDAVRNGHQVLAVVKGSAVNQDGASNGLTAPNGPSQERVIRQALANSGLSAADVQAVEAHGTGTTLGDPIEAQAILATYGEGRSEDAPLWLGSLKSNIGHTQAAAGVAGVIKMVMAMREGVLPRTLHVDEPTPHVDWSAGAVELLRENTPWTVGEDRPRRAGVSSFGISGTNAHVVLEQAPVTAAVEPETGETESGVVVWPVSGHTAPALAAQAAQLHAWLEDHPDADLPAVADALGRTRATLDHRAVVFGTERGELLDALAGIAAGTPTPHGVTGRYQAGKLAVLFTGQGSQYPGMGHGLYTTHPVFRDALDEACAALDPHLPVPLLSVMFAEPGTPEADLLHHTTYTQPALFALETALYRLVESYGVRPDALAGHSIGELTAAHAAGVFTLTDAAVLVATRARLMGELPAGQSTMLTLHTTPDHITPLLEGTALEIAARNSPTNTVVSGTVSDIETLTARAAEAGIRTRALNVSHAFHSAHMDPVLTTFRATFTTLTPQPPALPVISNRTGQPLTPEQAVSPDYWTEQLRHSVNYSDITEHLDTTGTTTYLELGPDTTLTTLTTQTLPDATAIGTLHPKHPHHHTLHTALATLHTHHTPLTWPTTTHPTHHHPTLPTYAFQHHHYWLNAPTNNSGSGQVGSAEEARFWQAIEQGDLDALATALRLPGDADSAEATMTALSPVLPMLSSWRKQHAERSAVSNSRYQLSWTPVNTPSSAALSGRWLVVSAEEAGEAGEHGESGSSADWTAWCTAALRRAGAEVVELKTDGPSVDRADFVKALGNLPGDEHPPAGVLSLLALTGTDATGYVPLSATAALIQALGDAGWQAPMWSLTSGAVSTGVSAPVTHPAQAHVWGLGRVAAAEHPDRWGGLVDVVGKLDERSGGLLAATLAGNGGEDQVAIRPGGVFGCRLRTASVGRPPRRDWRPAGTVLVTGGTGALGAHVARWLAGKGAAHLLLTSRRGESAPGAGQLRAELEELGATVTIAACDVADRGELASVLAAVPTEQPLTAVVHTAGLLDDGVLDALTPERLKRVLRPKTDAVLNLHELTKDLDLSAFVLFSSIAGVLGSMGQANYAAANAHLDAFSEYRRAAGLPTTSIAWGPWSGDGMAADEAVDRNIRDTGVRPLAPDVAIAALQEALDRDETRLVVADIDWQLVAASAADAARRDPLLGEFPEVRAVWQAADQVAADGALAATALRDKLQGAGSKAEREQVVLELVQSRLATVLGHGSADLVEGDKAFREVGLDSLGSIKLRNAVNAATGLNVSATLLYDYPTPLALSQYLLTEITEEDTVTEATLLAELERLDGALRSLALADSGRRRVAGRLQVLLSKWGDGPDQTDEDSSHQDLDAVTAEELFDLISDEFGKS